MFFHENHDHERDEVCLFCICLLKDSYPVSSTTQPGKEARKAYVPDRLVLHT